MKILSFLLITLIMTFSQLSMANVDEIGGYRILITSSLDDNGMPTDEIETIQLDHKLFYVFSEWNLPAGEYRYSCIIYDGDRRVVNSQFNTFKSSGGNFNFWCSHDLDKSTDKPGDWYAEMGIEGFNSADIYFSVTEDDIRNSLIGNWDWSNEEDSCNLEHVINISFNVAGTKMYHTSKSGMKLTTSDELYEKIVYSILSEGDKYLRTIVINESQKTDNGEIFLWDLILNDDKSFCWKQSEWPEGHCTEKLVKCDK
ncbi:hypothetical protein FE810_02955 [Thalassotalea litorea]|uniref:Uncharacterized protein n=1 Tax=Thalassotalea litorea TaxID=2020715 RepID=A0A5R9IZB6_9GAMM|nr:hypothetical protein [Thalassotalea litorea]TLU67258.1 hypothetical protein FE810_02955 [Thalassotalea litorea]